MGLVHVHLRDVETFDNTSPAPSASTGSRRYRLLAAAVVALVTGSVASAGPGLAANAITITADGVSPKSLVIKAASVRFFPVWTNLDAVAHTVRFDNGRCVRPDRPRASGSWCEGPGAGFSYVRRNLPLPGQRPGRPDGRDRRRAARAPRDDGRLADNRPIRSGGGAPGLGLRNPCRRLSEV